MPKMKTSEQEEANRIIRACVAAGMERQAINDEGLAIRLGVSRETIRNKRNRPETFTARELRQLSRILKFTPVQAASVVLGRDLTAKEIKDFILM